MKKTVILLMIYCITMFTACTNHLFLVEVTNLGYGKANDVDNGKVVGVGWYDGELPYTYTVRDKFVSLEVPNQYGFGVPNAIFGNRITGRALPSGPALWTNGIHQP